MGSDVNPSTPVVTMGIFQSTPPAWEATIQLFRYQPGLYISIHAPAWGATAEINNRPCAKVFQSTPPHGERRMALCREKGRVHFNPRPRMGSDPSSFSGFEAISLFQSTLLAWGATNSALEQGFVSRISIHAPRMGSDTSLRPITCSASYFNPRSPHGERQRSSSFRYVAFIISIHAPAWGATIGQYSSALRFPISIHAPAWGATQPVPGAWRY